MKETVLEGTSKNIVNENIEKLKSVFPEAVFEDKVDLDLLELILRGGGITKILRMNFIISHGLEKSTL